MGYFVIPRGLKVVVSGRVRKRRIVVVVRCLRLVSFLCLLCWRFLVLLGFRVKSFILDVGLFFLFPYASFQLHLVCFVCTLCAFSKHFYYICVVYLKKKKNKKKSSSNSLGLESMLLECVSFGTKFGSISSISLICVHCSISS